MSLGIYIVPHTLIGGTDTIICMSFTDYSSVTTVDIIVSVLPNVYYGAIYKPLKYYETVFLFWFCISKNSS